MSERYATYLSIGGELAWSDVPLLLQAIAASHVATEWGGALTKPTGAAELLSALHTEGQLWFCDDECREGEFPKLEAACRSLGLPYRRCTEGTHACDPEVVDWRPGMVEPIVRIGSNCSEDAYAPERKVKEALNCLERGDLREAITRLQALYPEVPDLPPFKIV